MDEFEKMTCRLWDHVLKTAYGTTELHLVKNLRRDPEGYAFFNAIDLAFVCNKDSVTLHPEVISYVAEWCKNVATGDDEMGGPFGPQRNYFVYRAFKAFIYTLRDAVKDGKLRRYEGKWMLNAFEIPLWFIELHKENA